MVRRFVGPAGHPTRACPAGQSPSTNTELLKAVEGVLEAPGADDPAVAKAEDGDLVDVLEAASGGRATEPFAEVGGGAGEAPDDLVALRDELDDLHVDIRERRAERCDPVFRPLRHGRCVELVDHVQVPAVENLID